VRRVPTRSSRVVADAAFTAVVLAVAYALKRRYSIAGADELGFVLAPTATVAGALSRAGFVREAGVGYVSTSLATVIAPACAGVNFLIIAFSMLGLGFVRKMPSAASKASWILLSGAVAYAATILVNGARIAAGARLHALGASLAPLSPGAAHRALGTAVYLSALWALFSMAEATVERLLREPERTP